MIRDNVIQKLKESKRFLQDNFGVKEIGLFGSYAKNDFTDASDIDIYIECDIERLTYDKYFELIEFLEKEFGKKIDIITKGGIQTIRIPEVQMKIKDSIVYV